MGFLTRKKSLSLRHRRIRLLILWLKNLFLLRLFRYASTQIMDPVVYNLWTEIGGFTTNIKLRSELEEQNANRIHNMAKCSELISGIVLKPGELFSLMRVIGEPSVETGFKTGPMIIHGKLHQVAGGGVCQVSTTLFNMALESGLTIIEKHNHSWDIWGENRFIDLGRDASFVYGRKDLIFKNPFKTEIVILLKTDPEKLEFSGRVLSKEPVNIDVEIESHVLKQISGTHGKQDSKDVMVETSCNVRNGNRVRCTYKRKEIYKPV